MPSTVRFGFTVANIGTEPIPCDGNWASRVCLTEELTGKTIPVSSVTAIRRGNGSGCVIHLNERIRVELLVDKPSENSSFVRLTLRAPDGTEFEKLALLQRY
jgi:hypothetical protein